MQLSQWLSDTMLIERSVGALSYTLVVFYVFKTIKRGNPKKSIRALNIALVILVLLAFFYIPGKDADLTRIRLMTLTWGQIPLQYFFEGYFMSSSTPIGYLLYYIAAKIGIPGLLPAFCALVFYGNSFHIVKSLIKDRNYTCYSIAYSFLLFMSSGAFLEVISDVRCFVALSIVMRFVFDELFYGKAILKHLIFYIIAALMHPAAIVAIVLWLVFYLFIGERRGIINTVLNILTILVFLGIAFSYGNSFISETITKANSFITGSNAYSYAWEYLIGALQVVVYMYILLVKRFRTKHLVSKTDDLSKLSMIILLIVVALSFEYNIFHRYILAASLLMIPVVSDVLTQFEKGEFSGRKYVVVQLFSYAILLLACARGNLCGFKFFLLS